MLTHQRAASLHNCGMRTSILAYVAAVLLALGGCSTIASKEMQLAQYLLASEIQSAEDMICKFIPMNTWRRLYGISADRAEGWNKLCNAASFMPRGPQ